MLSDAALKRLEAIVGPRNCRRGEMDLALYAYDSSPFIHRPEAVIFPATAEEAAAVIALAAEESLPIVPRGAGTSLSGGAVPWKGGLCLAAAGLNRVLELDALEETVLVECGVVNLDLQKYLEPYGFMFPPDPASQKSSTLGGNLGENAGGMRGVKYGITKHHVLGLEVVLADGRLARTGRLARGPEAAGPDLTGLFLASEGTLGFITKALLKITPLPRDYRTVSAIFDDLGKSGQAVSAVIAAGIIPTAMEIMDHNLIVALEDYLHLGFPREAEAMLLIEVDGLGPELDRQMDRVVELCRQAGAVDLRSAETAGERDQLWLARRSGNGAMGRIKPALMVQDVTVPVNRLPEMLSLVQAVAAKHKLIIVEMAHAGDGNLHPHILYTPGDDDEYQRALAASHDIFHAALEAGGALTGEHGIGLEKVAFMDKQFTADELAFMARLKHSLDPAGILNPGKVLPEGGAKADEEPRQAESAAASPVYPQSVEEATRILRAAYLAQRPVTPAGRLSTLSASPAALVVSTRDLTRLISLEPENLLIEVEAGMTPAQLEEALRPTRLYWPVTGQGGRTLGAIMAEGLLGAETMARGSMIDWVLGTSLISPEGRLVKSGGRTLKNVSGYDFTRLAWRSRGRLGLCASFILKLLPRPEQAPVLEFLLATPTQAASVARNIILHKLRPEGLRLAYDGRSTRLLVWLAGFEEVVAAQTKAMTELAGASPVATHPDGFAFWEERAAHRPPRSRSFLGSRQALLNTAARLSDATGLAWAELDFGGGRAEFFLNDEAHDQRLAVLTEGLIPDRFISSGPVYERLKVGLDPEFLFFAEV